MSVEAIIKELERDDLGRLKWLVLREFGVLPSSREARALRDEDLIVCGAHMLLDRRLRTGERGAELGQSDLFDEARFALLSEGER